jgi:hypothetical protein
VFGMNRTVRTSAIAATLATTLIAMAGCQHLATIKSAGGVVHKVRTITLQMPDAGDPDGVFFAHDVSVTSQGS